MNLKKTGMKKKIFHGGYFARGRTRDIFKMGDKHVVKWDDAKDIWSVSKIKIGKSDYWFKKDKIKWR